MARYNPFAGRNPHNQRPFGLTFVGTTKGQVCGIAKQWLNSNPNMRHRKMGRPIKQNNGQWSILLT